MIRGEGVIVGEANRRRVDGVDIELEPGAFVAVCGPNGSGKSTLVKALCGEVLLDGGRVALDERSIGDWPRAELARRLSVMLQEVPVRFPFRVSEVALLGRAAYGSQPSARDAKIALDALAAVDASGLADRFYMHLSGGERQRVQLARILAQVWEPPEAGARYLLLDEPTASLDLAHQHRVLDLARQFARRGAGVLAVVHDLHLCAQYADRVLLLDRGRLVAEGSPPTVLRPEIIEEVFAVRTVEARDDNGGTYLVATGVD